MDGAHQLVGLGGDDGETLDDAAIGSLPMLPQARQRQGLAIFAGNEDGLLTFSRLPPFTNNWRKMASAPSSGTTTTPISPGQ